MDSIDMQQALKRVAENRKRKQQQKNESSINTTSSQPRAEEPKPMKIKSMQRIRSSPKAEVVVDGDTVLLKWIRTITIDKHRNSRLLNLPKEIDFTGQVSIVYNPVKKQMVIGAV